MKRSWFLLAFVAIAAVALLLVRPFSLAETGDVTVAVSSAAGAPGEEVTVTLSVTENPGLRAISFTLDYDSGLLTPVAAAYTDGFGSDYATEVVLESDPIIFNRIFRSTVTATGAFATVTFRIDGTASAVTPLTLASRGDAGWTLLDGVSAAPLTTESGTVTIQAPAALSFTLSARSGDDDATVRLYPASLSDEEIRADLAAGTDALTASVQKGAITSSGGRFTQRISLSGALPGSCKLAVSKPGKHAPRVLPVTLSGSELDLGEIVLLLYGDVNDDATVNAKDALQISRCAAGKSSVFGSTADQDFESYRLFAAVVISGGSSPNAKDALQISRYSAGKSSVFDRFN